MAYLKCSPNCLNPDQTNKNFHIILVCGEEKRVEEAITTIIDSQEKGVAGLCTNVLISDRFSLTAAHCLENDAYEVGNSTKRRIDRY